MGKIIMSNQAYGKAIVGQEGEATPECGIVPTEFADNGFVLSIDSYGDVMPYALHTGLDTTYDSTVDGLARTENLPESIDITDTWDFTPVGAINSSFIHELTFKTTPQFIGNSAFECQDWLTNIEGGLPEGLETIGAKTFYKCRRLKIDQIPASVNTINEHAFEYSNDKKATIPEYDENNTYSIGDVVYYSSSYYTCIQNIESPESFNTDHWYEAYAPGIVGMYNPEINYQEGDGVIVGDIPDIEPGPCTLIDQLVSPTTIGGSYLNFKGNYNENTSYTYGDVVIVNEDSETVYYTCLVNSSTTGSLDHNEWFMGYAPNTAGLYNDDTTYHVGEVVIDRNDSEGGYFTCIATTTGNDPSNTQYWCSNQYCPGILGIYNSNSMYKIGDTVSYNDYVYTCISAINTPEAFDSNHWYMGYYHGLTIYNSATTYNPGDVVYDSSQGAPFTCVATTTGNAPDKYDDTYWVAYQYQPDVVGKLDTTRGYNKGDIVYNDQGSSFDTINEGGGTKPYPVPCWCPDTLGVFDTTKIYHAGDIVLYKQPDSSEDYFNGSDWYVCVVKNSTPGSFETDVEWKEIFESSTAPYYKVNKIQFLGTPTSVDSSAFENSDYNIFLFPWSENEGPFDPDSSSWPVFAVYDYTPEGE